MGIQITARHDSVSDGMKRYAEEKAGKLLRFFDGISKMEIILDGQGPEQTAEIVINVVGSDQIKVSGGAQKMNAAIDAMIDKAERKIRRHKEKLRGRRTATEPASPAPADEERLESYDDVIDKTEFPSS